MTRPILLPLALLFAMQLASAAEPGASPARLPDASASPRAGAADAGGPALKEVVVVFKTHFDIGFTDLARNVVNRYRTTMIDQALEVCDASTQMPPEQRFVWTLAGWPMAQALWPGQTSERREQIEQAVRAGRLVWHALPGSLHTESLDLEDLVRGLGFSSGLSRSFDLPLPRDAKMTDVPAHTWLVPTLLKHAGVDFLHLGCNAACSSPEVPMLFWWAGPDGSRLLTMYSAAAYGTGLHPPKDWPHETWLALIHTGDNHGPPTPDEVKALLDQARRELPGVNVRLGRLSDFSDAILREKPDLPVVRADMPDTWIHGIMSAPIETKLARNLRPRIGALEALDTLLRGWGVGGNMDHKTISAAYEQSLLYGEHTWGFDLKPFGYRYGEEWRQARARGHYARLEESWEEHSDYIRTAEQHVRPALESRLQDLARAVNVAGPRIVVFNPLPWKRHGVVSVLLAAGGTTALKDVAGGKIVPAFHDGQALRFVARDLPPLGYRTFVPATARPTAGDLRADPSAGTLENAFFKATLDSRRGTIASLLDKKSGRELVEPGSGSGLGQYLYERFDSDQVQAFLDAYLKLHASWAIKDKGKTNLPPASEYPHVAASPANFTCAVERNAVAVSATLAAAPGAAVPHAVQTRVVLYRGLPFVDVEWTVADKPPEVWPEAGWLCFPLGVEQPRFRLGRVGSIVDPATDVIRGANHHNFCLSSGLTVTGRDGAGVGLCALDTPLVSLEQPGIWSYSRRFVARKPMVFFNLFNNQYNTNFRIWQGGSWSSRVRLWAVHAHAADDESALITPAWEARSPCLAVAVDAAAGGLPTSQPGLELSRRGVLVTAFGPNPDGAGVVLRLWEQAGRSESCRVRLPQGLRVARAQPCDLRGQSAGESIILRQGRLDIPLAPFAPVSLILR
ncbi:MAG: hypothetical protein FJ387_11785 [Verrucomicrobia bacterium]|nr:hypothetical protein [Verrucomicrobiota bacterium]